LGRGFSVVAAVVIASALLSVFCAVAVTAFPEVPSATADGAAMSILISIKK